MAGYLSGHCRPGRASRCPGEYQKSRAAALDGPNSVPTCWAIGASCPTPASARPARLWTQLLPLGEAVARVRARVPGRSGGGPEPAEAAEPPTCAICKDHGFVRRDVELGHPDFGRAIPCSCRLGEVRERLRRRSNLGSLGSRSFETFLPQGREPLSEAARQQLRAAF